MRNKTCTSESSRQLKPKQNFNKFVPTPTPPSKKNPQLFFMLVHSIPNYLKYEALALQAKISNRLDNGLTNIITVPRSFYCSILEVFVYCQQACFLSWISKENITDELVEPNTYLSVLWFIKYHICNLQCLDNFLVDFIFLRLYNYSEVLNSTQIFSSQARLKMSTMSS